MKKFFGIIFFVSINVILCQTKYHNSAVNNLSPNKIMYKDHLTECALNNYDLSAVGRGNLTNQKMEKFMNYNIFRKIFDSGGELGVEQAAYDVKFYDLDLNIDIDAKAIDGCLRAEVEIVASINYLVFDLENNFTVDSVKINVNGVDMSPVFYNHVEGKINVQLSGGVSISDLIIVEFFYHGVPPTMEYSPNCGFDWDTTPSGIPWIGIFCEGEGADVWFPCKDHPSDEPDSVRLHFTVPQPLICVSNGISRGSIDNGDGTTTFNWFVSTPINNYNVTLCISNYQLIEDQYLSVDGSNIPFHFWIIPEKYDDALNHMPVFRNEFNFLESICGPFPFGMDKHGWAYVPFVGMEHQTLIAYGSNFLTNSWGYDRIHLHELAHEWWGNLVTAKDWSDLWIHEGMASYMEALYVESISGTDRYHEYMNIIDQRSKTNYSYSLAPYESMGASQAYWNLNPYYRGACVIHTLRYHLGDEMFFNLLKHWAYPDTSDTDNSGGRQCRIVSTNDMKNSAETVTCVELNNFFEVFFREVSLPHLDVDRTVIPATFTWITENNVPLDLNIPVAVNGISQTVIMDNGQGTIEITAQDDLIIDPQNWILMADPVITSIENLEQPTEFSLFQNYPNPFNPMTKIQFFIAERCNVKLNTYDILGKEVMRLVDKELNAGKYEVSVNAISLASGLYFYQLTAKDYVKTMKMLLIK
ncbi:M1 family aminopeptidase [Bacteroidota bacterium]